MEVSRLGYFNAFCSGNVAAGKNNKGISAYWGRHEASMASGEEGQEKDGLQIKQESLKTGQTEVIKGSRLRDHLNGEDNKAPYYHLSDNGIIDYNGVTFVCDTEHNQLHLGDTSDKKNCLTISLSGGGSLVVNRDNIDQLAKAISMFSPEDINLIMRALNIDAKARQVLAEIEDEECAVGEEITDQEEAVSGEDAAVADEGEEEGFQSVIYQSLTYEKKK